jgi:hypothetical protein
MMCCGQEVVLALPSGAAAEDEDVMVGNSCDAVAGLENILCGVRSVLDQNGFSRGFKDSMSFCHERLFSSPQRKPKSSKLSTRQ